MLRRAMSDPISWVLMLVAVVMSAVAVANIGTITAVEGCLEGDRMMLTALCAAGPDRLTVLVEVLLACAAWCLVGMRAARLPR